MSNENPVILQTDFCVVGGGISGICAAVSAARCGIKVILVQDRNVLGGNASSEIRMWIRGAGTHLPPWREGGLIEELALDNLHYNPGMNYSLWDAVLYNKVVSEPNITLMLGTTCIGGNAADNSLRYIDVWQLNTYKRYRIYATYFADCSGDSILATCSGADFTVGREGRNDYNESQAPSQADNKTMGNSCLMQLRHTQHPIPYVPFPFEQPVPDAVLQRRLGADYKGENFWWLELGGNQDTLSEADTINKELLGTAFYTWNYLSKNTDTNNWKLDWIGFLQGKRESRRYLGDYVLTQNDIENAVPFPDEVAYGGWPMDNHNPDGLYGISANTFGPLKQPYPIPYRCLYSRNVNNLFFAGRNISATHLAMSSTRVMATCGMVGQAVGCAAAIAKKHNIQPRQVLEHIDHLKTTLQQMDCYLLNTPKKYSAAMTNAVHNLGDRGQALFNAERILPQHDQLLILSMGERIQFTFDSTQCRNIRLVFDSDFSRANEETYYVKQFPMRCYTSDDGYQAKMPNTLVKEFVLEILVNNKWQVKHIANNFQRLVTVRIDQAIEGLAFTGIDTYGSDQIRLFSIDIIE